MKRIAIALALTAVAAGCLWMYAQSLKQESVGGSAVAIVAAARDFTPGSRLSKADLAVVTVPEAYVHPGAIRHGEETQVIGRPLVSAVAAGQAVLWSDFEGRPGGAVSSLAGTVPKGLRAFTIPVDASASHAGLLSAGDRVDILGTFTRQPNEWATVTLLQNAVVLATGDLRAGVADDPAARGPRAFSTITVAVDLESAEVLAFAQSRGQLATALRGRDDMELVDAPSEKGWKDLLDKPQLRRAAVPVEPQTHKAPVPVAVRKRVRGRAP